MMNQRKTAYAHPATSGRGFGLIELMISMAIASVLVLGLVVLVGNTQRTFSSQTDGAAINDKERFVADLLGNAIQNAGYYTMPAVVNSTTWTPQIVVTTFPLETQATGNFAAGQVVSGITGGAPGSGGDTLNVRFQATNAATDPFSQNCLGASANGTVQESMFEVVGGNLVCSTGTNGGALANQTVLIDGVTSMTVLYGVDTASAALGTTNGIAGSANEYIPATSMTAADWRLVRSVMVTLVFTQTKSMAVAPQPFTQVFQVMYETVATY